jgi:NitT/TauT family transport system substrate-binding protein
MKQRLLIGLAAASVFALTACGTSAPTTDSPAPGADAAPIQITVGALPVADAAAVWLAKDQGFFSDEGLDVTIETTSGGAAAVPGVISGSYDFAFANIVSLMVARDKGLDLRYVTNANSAGGDPDFAGVIVRADSPIKTAADLAGKTVSTNQVQNIGDTAINGVVDKAGADWKSIKWVEVAIPDVEAAVENKQIDAGIVLNPFLAGAVAHGLRVVSYPYYGFDPKLDIAGLFTTGETIKNKPEMVKKFTTAMNKSLTFAQKNPDAVRQIVTTYTKMTAEQLKEMVLPTYRVEFNLAADKKLAEAAVKFGTLTKVPDFDLLFPKQ